MVLADVEMSLVEVADLDSEIADGIRCVAEVVDFVEEEAEIACVFAFEETVFVFLEDLAEVGKLFVVVDEIADVTTDFVDTTRDVVIKVFMFEGVFHAIEFTFVLFDEGEVAFDELVEKVIKETLQAREAPFFGIGDALDEFAGGTTVVDKDDAFLIEGKGEIFVFFREVGFVGNAKSTGDGVVVEFGLGNEYFG